MSIVIQIDNLFKRMADAGVVNIPKRQYAVRHGTEDFKVLFDSKLKRAGIWMKTDHIDKPGKEVYIQVARFYPRCTSWTGTPRTDMWMNKFVAVLEAAEAIIVKEHQDGK
jgi:hypothetical protein